jgi:hypothetical protein
MVRLRLDRRLQGRIDSSDVLFPGVRPGPPHGRGDRGRLEKPVTSCHRFPP